MGPTPSEARIGWFMQAQKDGYKFEQSYRNAKEDARKDESWIRNVSLSLHQRAFPAGFHAPNSECSQAKEIQGCPFSWSAKYLAGF